MAESLLDLVRSNIAAAVENDYPMTSYTDEGLAGDLLETFSFEEVLAAVKEWRKEQSGGR